MNRQAKLPLLPGDLFFFSLPLDGQALENGRLIITRDILDRHYLPPKGRLARSGVQVSYTGFSRGIVTIQTALPDDRHSHTLYLHVTAVELQVACSCGMPGHLLCRHAYLGLHALIWQSAGLELTRFYWPGFTEGGRNRYFEVVTGAYGIMVRERKEFGGIFRPVLGFREAGPLVLTDTGAEATGPGEDNPESREVTGYAILHSIAGGAYAYLPVLLPFIAIKARQGSGISSYVSYLFKDKPLQHGLKLTGNQVMLNELSHDMLTLARQAGQDTGGEAWQKAGPLILNLWKMAIPGLQAEQYLQSAYAHGLKHIREKPKRSAMQDAAISKGGPGISFAIRDHGDYYTIKPVLKANGREIISFSKGPLFVINTVSNHFYLLSNQREEQLLDWLDKSGNRLTVLKAHFREFEQEYLSRLVKYYPFVYYPYRSRKGQAYDLRSAEGKN